MGRTAIFQREMKRADLRRCEIQEWYPTFKPYTIKTLIHPLPPSFVRYLLGQSLPSSGDGASDDPDAAPFFLPRSATGADPFPRATTTTTIDPVSSLSLFDSGSDSDSDNPDADPADVGPPCFPDLESAVHRSIHELGGAAFPKLNWSSPKDAAWISFDGTLRCTSFSDIALLLRSSDAIVHDLCHAIPSCSDYDISDDASHVFYLALRKWYPSFHPEMEFRCFVRGRRLIAVSQREVTGFYPVLLERQQEIRRLVEGFFEEVVGLKFESEDYTFDVYVTRDERVKLLDFNPWGVFTLPLLFTWEELEGEGFGNEGVEFRVVESRCGVRPGLKTAVPHDYLDTGEGSGWDQFFKKVYEEQREQAQELEEN